MSTRIALASGLLVIGLGTFAGGYVHAQPYPSKPVRMIIAFPPGGASDGPARIMGSSFSQQTGQQFILENRAGASGIIGVEAVAKSTPDGHTLLVASASNVITQALFQYQNKPLPFDMVSGFQHVAVYGITSSVIVANPKVAAKSIKELVEFLKPRPGSLTYGSPGNGTASHLAMEMLKQHLGVDITHVPYKAAATASVDLLSGQIDLSIGAVFAFVQHIQSGKLRALAVTTRERSAQLPDVPTVAESHPGYESTGWAGLFMPANTPKEVVERLEQMVNRALQEPKTRDALLAVGMTPSFMSSRDATAKVKSDLDRYSDVVRRAKLTID